MDKLTVLIIDSIPERRMDIEPAIEELGHTVFSVSNAASGLIIFANIRIDVIIADEDVSVDGDMALAALGKIRAEDYTTVAGSLAVLKIGSSEFPWYGMTPEEIEKALRG